MVEAPYDIESYLVKFVLKYIVLLNMQLLQHIGIDFRDENVFNLLKQNFKQMCFAKLHQWSFSGTTFVTSQESVTSQLPKYENMFEYVFVMF